MNLKASIFLESYGAYNGGMLLGDREYDITNFDLGDLNSLIRATKKLHLARANQISHSHWDETDIGDEWFCPDYDVSFCGVQIVFNDSIGLGASPYTILEKVIAIRNATESHNEVFVAGVLEYQDYSGINDFSEAARLFEERITLKVEAFTDYELGYALVRDIYPDQVNETFRAYIDYEAFGRSYGINGAALGFECGGEKYYSILL